MLVQELEELQEVLHRAADPIEGGAEDGVDPPGADILEELRELGASERLGPGDGGEGVAGGIDPVLPAGGGLVLMCAWSRWSWLVREPSGFRAWPSVETRMTRPHRFSGLPPFV